MLRWPIGMQRVLKRRLSWLTNDPVAGLDHVFDGVADFLAAEAGVFDAAAGHVVEAPGEDKNSKR